MNPTAFILIVVATFSFIVGAFSGTFNGASLVGVVLVLVALSIQVRSGHIPQDHPDTYGSLDLLERGADR